METAQCPMPMSNAVRCTSHNFTLQCHTTKCPVPITLRHQFLRLILPSNHFSLPVLFKPKHCFKIDNLLEDVPTLSKSPMFHSIRMEFDGRFFDDWNIYTQVATSNWRKLWKVKISQCQYRVVFNPCVLPCLTYHLWLWNMCQRAIERIMIGVKIKDRVSNNDIRNKTKVTDILTKIESQKWR